MLGIYPGWLLFPVRSDRNRGIFLLGRRRCISLVEAHLAGSGPLEYALEMGGVVGVSSRLDDHIVHVHLEGVADLPSEHFVHHSLIRGARVLEAEGHYVVVVVARLSHKRCALLIAPRHRDLVVT